MGPVPERVFPLGPPAVAETHSGVVFFLGDRAYKVKKPVDLGFLDFTTLAARRAISHREVELNRRLAPDAYLGVADVVGPSGDVCEHIVVMRRMPDDRRLSALVAADIDVDGQLDQLAGLLAVFHASAERSPAADEAAGADALSARWSANSASLLGFAGRYVTHQAVTAVDDLAHRYLAGRRPLRARAAAGVDASDADPAVAAAMAAAEDPWPSAVAVDTSRDARAALGTAIDAVTRVVVK